MLNRNSFKNLLVLIGILFFIFYFLNIVDAQKIPDLYLPKISFPGMIEGEGNHFEIKDSTYLNITLDSSEPIKLRLESIPEMVTMMFEKSALTLANQTQITIKGFVPLTTYYLYEDNYHNLNEITADENGSYIYTQDLSKPHFVFIQPRKSTKFIQDNSTGGDCASIGIWDWPTKTCTLTMDVIETIQVDNDNITLDGNNHIITGTNTGGGVYLYQKTGVTIKNLNINGFTYGISLFFSPANDLEKNTTSNNPFAGILLVSSTNNIISNNTSIDNGNPSICGAGIYLSSDDSLIKNNITSNNCRGIYFVGSNSNTILDNMVSDNQIGFQLDYFSNNNIISNNTFARNNGGWWGIFFASSDANSLYHNNFIDNSTQAYIYNSNGNLFNLSMPIGGNYWNNFDAPAEGCIDINNDNLCDAPYIFSGGQDNYPWTKQNGWVVEKPLSSKAADLAKQVVNHQEAYLWGGKGWDYNLKEFVASANILSGYNYRKGQTGIGLDCSGLIMWTYDRSFDKDKPASDNFVKAFSADEQYKYNTTLITELDLQPGDVMFFDWDFDNHIDHTAIYVGESGGYDVVNAADKNHGITPVHKNNMKELAGFLNFKRVTTSTPLTILITSHSPIDLIVTDPDGFTITPTTTIPSETEYLREIPGVLYYSEMEQGEDGNPIDRVYSYTEKTGDYKIKIIPDSNAPSNATYSLDFTKGNQIVILAQNTPINQIPTEGYGVTVASGQTVNTFIPISIDIKPGSYPNTINLGSNGVVPVAIFGSATFDVKKINISTIKLGNASVKLKGNGQSVFNYSDLNADGFTDIIVKISTEALSLSLGDVKTNLEGNLTDGTVIKGSDSVRIVPSL